MSDRPLANALEWWLKEQNKFNGAKVRTILKGNQYQISEWVVSGVNKPTSQDIENIIDSYDSFLIAHANEKVSKKEALKTKLKLSNEEIETLKAMLLEG